MQLAALIAAIPVQNLTGGLDLEITGLHYDSRTVEAGGLFFALPGLQADGHDFIGAAVAAGAIAVVMERPCELPAGVTGIQVADARQAMGLMARGFFGDPAAEMTVVGVTGTNGKTTVTYLVESLFRAVGKQPGIVGTVAYRCGALELPAPHTTPEAVDLYRALAEFRQAGCDALVMEISSHALAQHRIAGLRVDVGVFTNLTPEHLDYHRDMEGYFAAKQRLFCSDDAWCARRAVINLDDPYGARLAEGLSGVIGCSGSGEATLQVLESELSLAGIRARIDTPRGELQLTSPLLGRFNLQNLLCAAGVGLALELPLELIATALAGAERVPGRLEGVENRLGAQILVDYAHTGDALEKALQALRDLRPRRLITVFGCGGDRDRTKRPVMGEVAARFSELAIVTSDNPRTEEPLAILEDIRPGLEKVYGELDRSRMTGEDRGFLVIPDRREAIEFAVGLLQADDVLLVAGKGHEDYQILGRQKIHFDDREELRRAVAARERGL